MNKKISSKKAYALLACAIVSWCSVSQYAYAEAVSTRSNNNEVVVSTTRAEAIAKQDSQHVSIITKKDIEEKQAKTVEDIIFTQTGVSQTVDSMGRVGVSIRGADPRHTKILVDGKPVMGDFAKYMGASDEVMRIGTENVDHIEITQGAASSKYGSDAIGGVVNIITKKASKKPSIQFNIEGRRLAKHGGNEIAPYSNFFLRADSGKIGKLRIGIYGNKRDVMPIYATKERETIEGAPINTNTIPDNSLRYYGVNSTVGLTATYDLNRNQSITLKSEHYTEDLERYVKYTASYFDPQIHFKRKANRDSSTIEWKGRQGDDIDWNVNASYSKLVENDIGLSSDFGLSTYDGQNTLETLDNINHKEYSLNATVNKQINDEHLVTVALGASQEEGKGSRIKNAPKSYNVDIDPWDYDKSLEVNNDKPASNIHSWKMKTGEDGVSGIDNDWELYGYNSDEKANEKNYKPSFTYADFREWFGYSPSLDNGPGMEDVNRFLNGEGKWKYTNQAQKKCHEDAVKRYESFNKSLQDVNKNNYDPSNQ